MLAATESEIVTELLVVLAAACVAALIAQRLKLAVISGFLVVGALLGPGGLGLITAAGKLEDLAHLAVVLLMFGIGLELHLPVLRHGLREILIGGGLAVTSGAAFIALAWRFGGVAWPAAVAIGLAMSLSSTAVVLRLLTEQRRLWTASGRTSFGILVLQDILVLVMLASIPFLQQWATGGAESGAEGAAPQAWYVTLLWMVVRLAAIAGLMLVGRLVLPRLLAEAGHRGALDVLLIAGLAAALGAAAAAHALKFSLEMGAFLAGFLLASTPFRYQLSGQIAALRDLFIAVFFTLVGMQLELAVLVEHWAAVLGLLAAVIVIKACCTAGACRLAGARAAVAVAVGLGLSQAGEFSLILLDTAKRQTIIGEDVYSIAVAVVVLSLLLTPMLYGWGNRLAEKLRSRDAGTLGAGATLTDEGGDKAERRPHVVIAGFGPMGRRLLERLEKDGVPYVLIDLNPANVRSESGAERAVVFGDVASPAVLESAHLNSAVALAICVPDEEAALRACAVARQMKRDLHICVRVRHASRLADARKAGASFVIADEEAPTAAMVEDIYTVLGVEARPHTPSRDADDMENSMGIA